jgi:hypothetical protein
MCLSTPPSLADVSESWPEGRLVLPGGILDSRGKCHKTVSVRPLTGAEEELLADRRYQNLPQQVTDFLAQVITRVDGIDDPVTRNTTARMLIGDRDYLLLRLRQMNLSDTVEEVVRCPRPGCGKKADVEFSIGELEVRRAENIRGRYDFTFAEPAFADDPDSMRGAFRLPTGSDQEAVAELGDVNVAAVNTRLFSRVLFHLGRRAPVNEADARAMTLKFRRELNALIAKSSPGPKLDIEVQCPHCGEDITYPFDLYGFFLLSR